MTTLAEIAAKIETNVAIERARQAAREIQERKERDEGLHELYDLRSILNKELADTIMLLKSVVVAGNHLSEAIQTIDAFENEELTASEVLDLIKAGEDALSVYHDVHEAISNGDFEKFGGDCICGMCGKDDDDFEPLDASSLTDELKDKIGAAIQEAVENGEITPDGDAKEITVGGRTIKVVPLGVATTPEELEKLLAGVGLN